MNRIGATPFLLAAKVADVPLMKVFMELGADPKLMSVEEDTPLMAASGVGMSGVGENAGSNEEAMEAVKYILSLGPDVARVNAINTIGNTALHGAVIRGSLPLIQMLADLGIALDVRNKPDKRYNGGAEYANVLGGWTPLEIADGVIYQDTWKQDPDAAKLIRKLLADRGLPVPAPVYVNHQTGLAEVRRVGEATGGAVEKVDAGLGKVEREGQHRPKETSGRTRSRQEGRTGPRQEGRTGSPPEEAPVAKKTRHVSRAASGNSSCSTAGRCHGRLRRAGRGCTKTIPTFSATSAWSTCWRARRIARRLRWKSRSASTPAARP